MYKIETIDGLLRKYGRDNEWAIRHELEEYLTRKMPCVALEAQRHVVVAALHDKIAERKLTIDVELNVAADWDNDESSQTILKVAIRAQAGRYLHTQVFLSEKLLRMALLRTNSELQGYMG